MFASGGRHRRGVEEQGLADRGFHRRTLERLGDEEGRFGPGSGQQPLGKGGDEDHRHGELGEDILDRVDPARIVGELDVSQDQPRGMQARLGNRLVASDGDTGDIVTKVADDRLDVHRNDRLVLDDQHVGQRLSLDLGQCLADQPVDIVGIDAVKDILAEFSVPVIFITAFPERLLTGTRPEPTFLITKPFQRATVKAAISQALFFDAATVPAG